MTSRNSPIPTSELWGLSVGMALGYCFLLTMSIMPQALSGELTPSILPSSFPMLPASTRPVPADADLVAIDIETSTDLERVWELGVAVLYYQPNIALSLAKDEEQSRLEAEELSFKVIDSAPDLDHYFLVVAWAKTDIELSAVSSQVTPLGGGVFLTRGSSEEAEKWVNEGWVVHKLPTEAHAPRGPVIRPSTIPRGSVQDLVDTVSQARLADYVCKLQDRDSGAYCNADGSRNTCDGAGSVEARDYLVARFRELGLTVYTQDVLVYSYVRQNVIAELPGIGPDEDLVFIVSAHYDSRAGQSCSTGSPAPGADDDGSGTAAVLEAARVLSQHRFYHTIRFVAFAAEEQGLYGSAAYASYLRSGNERIGGVIHMDMIGWDSDGNGRMQVRDRGWLDASSRALADTALTAMEQYGAGLTPVRDSSGAPVSDHASFWRYGFPAIMITEDQAQDFNPYYHSTSDTVGRLRLQYMTDIVRGVVGGGATLAVLADDGTLTPGPSPTSPTPTLASTSTATGLPTPSPTVFTPTSTSTPTSTTSPTPSATLAFGPMVIVDDLGQDFLRFGPIDGWREAGPDGTTYNGHAYWTSAKETFVGPEANNWAKWRPNLTAGIYQVSVFVPWGSEAGSATRRARYEVHFAGGLSPVEVDQSISASYWVVLGAYSFVAGSDGYVELKDVTPDWYYTDDGQIHRKTVGFDAVRFTCITNCGAEPTLTPSVTWIPTLAPPSAPMLFPINNPDGSNSYVVIWNSPDATTYYELQESAGQSTWHNIYSGPDSSCTVNGRIPGRYHYRVRACNTTGCSDWSNAESTTVEWPCNIWLYVDNLDGDGDYTVQWSSCDAAAYYELQEKPGALGWHTIYLGPDTLLHVDRGTGTYSYRVRACNSIGCDDWSNEGSTTVQPTATAASTTTPAQTITPTRIWTATLTSTPSSTAVSTAGLTPTTSVTYTSSPTAVTTSTRAPTPPATSIVPSIKVLLYIPFVAVPSPGVEP